ncbi:MAG: amidophosphoribosyltransferase [Sulfolobus sp.]|jgi:amidophosphoribosyltransferase|nr:amidophosphoribosyltransferase [Sulfolobus sp.]
MAGIVGVLAFDKVWDVTKFVYYGMLGLQHRGYSYSGLSTLNEGFSTLRERKAPEDVEEDLLAQLHGWAGVGYSGNTEGIPVEGKEAVMVYDGVIKGDLPSIADSIARDPERALAELRGSASLIVLTKDGRMIGYRDDYGIKPLQMGGFGFDMAILASESSAFNVLGSEMTKELEPGEMVIIDVYGVETKQVKEPRRAYCAIDIIYQSRIDSKVFGLDVYDVRVRIGEALAEERPINGDVVIGVPDTAIPYAIGYSRKLGLRLDLGFTRTGSPIRTMLAKDDFLKVVGVQLKLNPIKSSVKGKKVVLIDDSMVTGNTLKNTVFNLRRLGAKEVHVLIGSPKLISACPYGMEVPDSKELIAANLSDEEIAKVIGADSIYWLSVEGLKKAIGHSHLCLGCMTKVYPKVI